MLYALFVFAERLPEITVNINQQLVYQSTSECGTRRAMNDLNDIKEGEYAPPSPRISESSALSEPEDDDLSTDHSPADYISELKLRAGP